MIPNRNNLTSKLKEHIHFSFTKTVKPTGFQLVSINEDLMQSMKFALVTAEDRNEAERILAGAEQLPDSWSLRYGGHQFDSWAGQLGDGRVISLAQYYVDNTWYELQLKGAGLTPYSRFGDGLAVLRSSIREYLCAEAMHGLGIPTSRSLSLVRTDTVVQRESPEPGAIVGRVAPSWIRFGSFEILLAQNETEDLIALADYVIDNHFEHLAQDANKYAKFAQEVVIQTAKLIAQWQAVGYLSLT
jgi:uncharacterized protein YdiU (UPF0061 family)